MFGVFSVRRCFVLVCSLCSSVLVVCSCLCSLCLFLVFVFVYCLFVF